MPVDVETAANPYEAFCNALRSRGPTLNLLFEQARISPEREGDTVLRDAFAGALIGVLAGMLEQYWLCLSGTKYEWKRMGALLGGYSIAQILSAGLDNSRHFEDWDKEKTAAFLQHRSVKVLSAVLGIPVKKTSKHAPFRGNVSWALLETLSAGGGYRSIESLVREFAASLQNRRAG